MLHDLPRALARTVTALALFTCATAQAQSSAMRARSGMIVAAAAPADTAAMPATQTAPATVARTSEAPAASPAARSLAADNMKMMRGMKPVGAGTPDQDFVAAMLPHHQGAVDMARTELQYGKDPELRRLATAIIKAQNAEIARMQAWQARHPIAR